MLLPLVLYLVPAAVIYILVRNYALLPASIPGPLLARFTNLHRLFSVFCSSPHDDQVRLHDRHGPFVRLGPNMVSVRGAPYASQIYGIGKGFVKSDYYSVFQNIVNGKRTASLVAMTDESDHARTKRVIAHAYSLSTLVEYEPLVDSTIAVLLENLSTRFAKTGTKCDFGQYLQYFAFDVIGELTFSKRLGFMEQDEDVDGIIAAIGSNFRYFSVLGQMPWVDGLLGKNPIYVRYLRKPVSSPILAFAQKLLQERLRSLDDDAEDKITDSDHSRAAKPDFLSRFLQARKDSEEPDLTTDAKLLSYLFMNINAGSDTIASTLKGIFYYLLTSPAALEKLMDELCTAQTQGELSTPCPTYAETQALPYLQAVIKEGLRLNPALSLPLERVVPKGGITLSATDEKISSSSTMSQTSVHLPAGTIVGINPYVQHRDPSIFCPPLDDIAPASSSEHLYPIHAFHPSRWLEPNERTTKRMEHALLTFGAGKRSCLGKNIAMLEVCKVVVAVLLRFELELVDPKAWQVENKWVLDQKGLVVRMKERS
ncbi:Pisatin demethylase [Cyphellophora attinorum]|uniref:Pisatin demethylase n=1 Tax=Cyphellophora attinorum TaxID=1664694 RepID=A0A0N1P3Q8_9EURO|nr:Pisatin demethylase [Phialophora attinorum]KPI44357.1 Pisatin demethylase [Phialophora attinorum]